MLRGIFGLKREKVVGCWRSLHNEKLHNLYTSPNIIRMIKSRIRWVWHVAWMGEMKNTYKILVGNLKGRDNSEDLALDEEIIFRMDFRETVGKCQLDAFGSE
jgi:hypothetical protein